MLNFYPASLLLLSTTYCVCVCVLMCLILINLVRRKMIITEKLCVYFLECTRKTSHLFQIRASHLFQTGLASRLVLLSLNICGCDFRFLGETRTFHSQHAIHEVVTFNESASSFLMCSLWSSRNGH